MTSAAAMSSSSHHQRLKKSLTAISAFVTPGSSPSPRSAKASVKAGTATAMMMINTMMATTMTIAG